MTDFGIPVGTLDRSVLYTRLKYCPTLPLKAFRREPAITQLDKPFTPTHSSSQNGFAPPPPVTEASRCPRIARMGFGSNANDSRRPVRTRFRFASPSFGYARRLR